MKRLSTPKEWTVNALTNATDVSENGCIIKSLIYRMLTRSMSRNLNLNERKFKVLPTQA